TYLHKRTVSRPDCPILSVRKRGYVGGGGHLGLCRCPPLSVPASVGARLCRCLPAVVGSRRRRWPLPLLSGPPLLGAFPLRGAPSPVAAPAAVGARLCRCPSRR